MKLTGIIAIIDDDKVVREWLTRALNQAGFKTRDFESATDFLGDLTYTGDVSLILLDMQMPRMSGFELQQRLHKLGANIPIIFLSATVDIPLASAMIRCGAYDVLPKPVEADVLVAKIREAVRARAA
jgi:FixJ family two-component response regulator